MYVLQKPTPNIEWRSINRNGVNVVRVVSIWYWFPPIQLGADSHLLHLFITALNAVTLSSCVVPQAPLRSVDCVFALPPENPIRTPNQSMSPNLTNLAQIKHFEKFWKDLCAVL